MIPRGAVWADAVERLLREASAAAAVADGLPLRGGAPVEMDKAAILRAGACPDCGDPLAAKDGIGVPADGIARCVPCAFYEWRRTSGRKS